MPIDNIVDLCDTQHAGKEIVKRPTFKSLQMTLCYCVACRHLTWKPQSSCMLVVDTSLLYTRLQNAD